MTPHNELRLLPWPGPDGKPCFLSTDNNGGPVSRLADQTEATQLEAGAELLEHALDVLTDQESDPEELRLLATDLTETLRDVLRVAASRGHRLPTTEPSTLGEVGEGPQLPAAAFG
ncbi:hypothetical protein [Streptomyces showdoensis]|uniref:Uncharacterized protein n=1 Tax=Streptomyces showdoensis TaxID=68268 RepID=A0A2P2GF44_STREW|nr:hypothetical protein [Streptomyces showdoensis]KKZ70136.1 hypothetical protein VO63_30535 [Streptomyces showdoensis]